VFVHGLKEQRLSGVHVSEIVLFSISTTILRLDSHCINLKHPVLIATLCIFCILSNLLVQYRATAADEMSLSGAAEVGKDTMKAVVYEEFGQPEDVLQVRDDVPVPQFRLHDVLVEVHAASLNPIDWKVLVGNFALLSGLTQKRPGFDFAGKVIAVGPRCQRLQIGDLVHGMTVFRRTGTLAEYLAVNEAEVAKIPEGMSMVDAAALPLAGLTANSISKYTGEGSRVLVLGGASATGSAGIQIAKLNGAKDITTTCSPHSDAYVRSLGATETVNYRKLDVWTAMREQGKQFDVIFDTIEDAVPGETWRGAVKGKVLARGGHLVTITGDKQGKFTVGELLKRGWQISARNTALKINYGGAGYHQYTQTKGDHEALSVLNRSVRLAIDSVYPLHETAAAFRRLMSAHRGKVLVAIKDTIKTRIPEGGQN